MISLKDLLQGDRVRVKSLELGKYKDLTISELAQSELLNQEGLVSAVDMRAGEVLVTLDSGLKERFLPTELEKV